MIFGLSISVYIVWNRPFPTSFGILIPSVGIRAVGDTALRAGQDNLSYMLAAGRIDRDPLLFFPRATFFLKEWKLWSRREHCAGAGITQLMETGRKEMDLQVCFYATCHMGEVLNFQQTGWIAEGKPKKGRKTKDKNLNDTVKNHQTLCWKNGEKHHNTR